MECKMLPGTPYGLGTSRIGTSFNTCNILSMTLKLCLSVFLVLHQSVMFVCLLVQYQSVKCVCLFVLYQSVDMYILLHTCLYFYRNWDGCLNNYATIHSVKQQSSVCPLSLPPQPRLCIVCLINTVH